MPFTGIHDHTLDSKSRLTIPAKARALLANGATLAIALDEPCLQVWPSAAHEQIVQSALAPLNPMTREARELRRSLYANADQTELDSAGRIMVTPRYAAHAGIERDVMVIGAGDYLELWDPETYSSHNADLPAKAADHIQSVGHPA